MIGQPGKHGFKMQSLEEATAYYPQLPKQVTLLQDVGY